jgi:queuosine precursor transporter
MKRTAVIAAAGFVACVLLANYATTEYGMVPVGFGLAATAGTYFAGLAFILRDSVQDAAGRRAVLGIIVAGAALSYLVSDPFIALASGVAFLVSEVADMAVYTPLRKGGYLRAAIASNVVGAFVDTVLFLWIAGFPIVDALAGQMVGKTAVTLAAVVLVVVWRVRRHPVRATGAETVLADVTYLHVACTAPRCTWTHDFELVTTVSATEASAAHFHNETRRRAVLRQPVNATGA